MCQIHHAACLASGEETCEVDFIACGEALSPGCELPSSREGGGDAGGSGGAGAGGAGGGGGSEQPSCEHDECVEGESLEETCSPCAASVCAEDPFCCETDWDVYCTSAASQLCGC
jgi:hypothetical protein